MKNRILSQGILYCIYNFFRSLDQVLNAFLIGNSRQTLSSRAYEAAVLVKLFYWKPVYYGINTLLYVIRWFIARPLGYRWGEDLPVNHCQNAFNSFPTDRTYQ